MSYHLCFGISAVCLLVAACMSVWRYATTGDNKFVKATAKVSIVVGLVISLALIAATVLSILLDR